MATSYIGGGRRNAAIGGDGVFRYHGDQYLTLKLAGTADDADTNSVSLSERSLVDLKFERRTGRGLQYNLNRHARRERLPARARVSSAPRFHVGKRRRQLLLLHR